MIAEFFITLGNSIATWFLQFLPDDDWSDGMVVTATNALGSVFSAAGGIANWFPFDVLMVCMVLVISTYVVLFMLKFLRWLWGLTPLSGGS